MYLKAEVVNNTFCKQLYKLMGNIVFGKMKLLNHLSEQYTFCTCSLGWEGRREEIPKGVLLMCTRKCWLIHMLRLTWLCSTNIFTPPPQFILLWLLNLDFLSKSSSPFSFHVPQGRSGDSFSQSIYSLICSNWFRERHTPNQSQWYVVKFFCRVCWEKGTFFFLLLDLDMKSPYWLEITGTILRVIIWKLRMKKQKSCRAPENWRPTGSWGHCFISLI